MHSMKNLRTSPSTIVRGRSFVRNGACGFSSSTASVRSPSSWTLFFSPPTKRGVSPGSSLLRSAATTPWPMCSTATAGGPGGWFSSSVALSVSSRGWCHVTGLDLQLASNPSRPGAKPSPSSSSSSSSSTAASSRSLEEYGMERAFEEPTLRFLFEGNEMDYKQEVREALLAVLPPRPRHFSAARERDDASAADSHSTTTAGAMQTRLLLRSLLRRGIASYAMQRSTPARLLALYEVVAGADPVLASVLAHHFTAAGMLATHGSPSLRQRYPHWLDQADTGHALGTTAVRELVTDDGPPVNTEARYDYHEKCFVLRGTGKFAVVGATLADYAIVSATLTTNKKEHNGVHLFVVPLREEHTTKTTKNPDDESPPKREKTFNGSLGSRRADILLEPIRGEGFAVTSSGTATLYFDHTKIPADHLLGPFCMDENTGKVVYRPELGGESGGLGSAAAARASAAAAAAAAAFRSLQDKMNQASSSGSKQRQQQQTPSRTEAAAGTEKIEEEVGRGEVETAIDVLRYRTRLATAAIAVGILKKQVRDAVQYCSQQHVVGPSGYRDYPYLGLQEVQSPLVALLVKSCVYALAWNRYLKQWCSLDSITMTTTTTKGATSRATTAFPFLSFLSRRERQTREMQLVGLMALLNEGIQVEMENFRRRFTHVHASFASTGAVVASTTLQLRQEGRDTQDCMREVARRSVVHNIGTTHWGWRISSVARRFPFLQRFIQNPLYSPRMADLGRHYLFFSHKHYGLKKRLQRSLKIETRRGGAEHAWHDWSTFRHRDIVHCGEAYMEMHLLEVMTAEMTECSGDLRARKLLRDMGWIYALTRQSDRLDYYVCTGQLSRNKAVILPPHLDNITTVFAAQSRHVAEALCGRWLAGGGGFTTSASLETRQSRRIAAALTDAPCGSEAYWTVLGASTHPERGESLITVEDNEKGGQQQRGRGREEENDNNSREAQENIQEEPEDFDLLHGLEHKTTNTKR